MIRERRQCGKKRKYLDKAFKKVHCDFFLSFFIGSNVDQTSISMLCDYYGLMSWDYSFAFL